MDVTTYIENGPLGETVHVVATVKMIRFIR